MGRSEVIKVLALVLR